MTRRFVVSWGSSILEQIKTAPIWKTWVSISTMKISDLKIHRERAVDMSAAGIAARLAALDELYELGMSLRKAEWIDPVEETASGREQPTHHERMGPRD